MPHPVVSRPLQNRFLDIPEAPLCYWLRERFFQLLGGKRLGDYAEVRQGLATGDNERFTRCFWEVMDFGVVENTKPASGRWFPYAKGGRYQKWIGLEWLVVDWQANAAVLRTSPQARFQSSQFYFQPGLTYSPISQGSLGARALANSVFDVKGASIFPRREEMSSEALSACLNTLVSSYLSRLVSQGFELHVGYLSNLPLTIGNPVLLAGITELAQHLKGRYVATCPVERLFDCHELLVHRINAPLIAVLHSIEGFNERLVCDSLEMDLEDVSLVATEVGSPAGWFQLLAGYDALPPLPACLPELPREVLASLERHERRAFASAELAELRRRLRQLYEAGPGDSSAGDESDAAADENDEEEETLALGARLPIPAETFIEELSQKLEVHPISIYWLLKEGIEREGWRCLPEERRLTEDRFTVLALRLLGHRWPKQLEAGEPLSAWADQDGVISLTSGGGETPLIERVRERLAEERGVHAASPSEGSEAGTNSERAGAGALKRPEGRAPGGTVAALEREFEEIVGASLEQWLAGPFFERHISQFKKRPIAWQMETEVRGQRSEVRGKGKAKRGVKSPPVFACLIYYHKLDEDLLPKLRTQYVGILRGGFETELRTLERLPSPTAEQQGRKLQLDHWIEEMKAFDAKLEQVSLTGFGPAVARPALRQYAINDALLSLTACWLRRLECGMRSAECGEKSEPPHVGCYEKESPLAGWCEAATATGLHADLPVWIAEAFSRLDLFCGAVGPKPPGQETFVNDPTSEDLAPLVCASPTKTVSRVLDLACERWWLKFEEAVLDPLKEQLKQKKEEQERVKEELELDEVKRDYARQTELADRKDELKQEIKALREDIDEKKDKGKQLRSQVESWNCPEAATWEDWLGTQPLFDAIASLDGKRKPPQTVAEFIAQESAYAPDINDGVRVNIAPVQKAGLLHVDVLDSKDADKAIADRAEWRADERRWVREGKLPQPGWWRT